MSSNVPTALPPFKPSIHPQPLSATRVSATIVENVIDELERLLFIAERLMDDEVKHPIDTRRCEILTQYLSNIQGGLDRLAQLQQVQVHPKIYEGNRAKICEVRAELSKQYVAIAEESLKRAINNPARNPVVVGRLEDAMAAIELAIADLQMLEIQLAAADLKILEHGAPGVIQNVLAKCKEFIDKCSTFLGTDRLRRIGGVFGEAQQSMAASRSVDSEPPRDRPASPGEGKGDEQSMAASRSVDSEPPHDRPASPEEGNGDEQSMAASRSIDSEPPRDRPASPGEGKRAGAAFSNVSDESDIDETDIDSGAESDDEREPLINRRKPFEPQAIPVKGQQPSPVDFLEEYIRNMDASMRVTNAPVNTTSVDHFSESDNERQPVVHLGLTNPILELVDRFSDSDNEVRPGADSGFINRTSSPQVPVPVQQLPQPVPVQQLPQPINRGNVDLNAYMQRGLDQFSVDSSSINRRRSDLNAHMQRNIDQFLVDRGSINRTSSPEVPVPVQQQLQPVRGSDAWGVDHFSGSDSESEQTAFTGRQPVVHFRLTNPVLEVVDRFSDSDSDNEMRPGAHSGFINRTPQLPVSVQQLPQPVNIGILEALKRQEAIVQNFMLQNMNIQLQAWGTITGIGGPVYGEPQQLPQPYDFNAILLQAPTRQPAQGVNGGLSGAEEPVNQSFYDWAAYRRV